jgi:MFS family permease
MIAAINSGIKQSIIVTICFMVQESLSDPIKEAGYSSLEKKPKLHAALRALKHRNYRLFFVGQMISLVGTWMQMVAQSWLVYRLTGSSVLLGTIGFASQIPVFLLAFIGGGLADRYSRHKLVITTQMASMLLAFALAVLTLTGTVQIWHIFILAVLLGVVNAFDMPGRQAFVVELIDKEDLMNAIALNSSVFNVARVIGPAVAGILIAYIGEGWCFLGNGLSYIAVIVVLLLMKLKIPAHTVSKDSILRNILEGFRYVQQTKPIRSVLLLLALVSMAGMPYSVLMPIFADRILHGGPRGLGILMGATGFGALVGAVTLAMRPGTRGLGKIMAYACAGFGVSLFCFSLSRNFWLSVLLLLPAGYSFMLQLGASNTFLQLMVPDHLRGRVMAVHTTIFMGMAPFGSLLAGFLAEHLGAPAALSLGGLACLAGAGLFSLQIPKLQMEGSGFENRNPR